MPAPDAFDVVVIGGGPGGYTAAIRAAQLGLRAALVEKEEKLGGICLNWGCIPTKALLKQAELYRLFQRAGEFGFTVGQVGFDWKKVVQRSRQVAERLHQGVEYLMKKNKVEVVRGRGRLAQGPKVEVRDSKGEVARTLAARHVVLATGSRPQTLPGVQLDGAQAITSREAMVLEQLPQSLAIIGAGAIGVEFAYFFNAFGTQVTLLEALPQILPREDEEVAGLLTKSLAKQGVQIAAGVQVCSVKAGAKGVEVQYRGKDGEVVLKAEKVLMAVGVVGNTEELGLETLGVKTVKGAVEVNDRQETNVKGICAIGDVAGPPQLAHVAAAEGVAAVDFIAGHQRAPLDRTSIPFCTYCQPQVASMGLSEAQAKKAGHQVKVGRFPFSASGKALAAGESEGLVKLVFDAKYGELLGASIIGAEATELIAELGLARHLEATYEELLHTMHAHPTLSEGVMEAAGEAFGLALNL
ncbi:MAG: dihydrolipoyl dehydrogenase [Candidatus Latescibacteria bacterium]|nr:dihydrolipoyl dehydrogenase [Candidatus Latescibacterota bacterium]